VSNEVGRVLVRLVMTTRSNTMFSGAFPDTEKAKKVLGFEATTTLDEMLDEIILWIDEAIKDGTI
jgi:nucleoside-diphosphate-sugar epimerase